MGIAVTLVILVALVRIVLTYRNTSVAWDEPCHIAAGLEWVDRGTYILDPIHPPLARYAIGLPLYLAGERLPDIPGETRQEHNYYHFGTQILYGSGHYLRNLVLARLGVLPFFVLAALLVFWWTRLTFGNLAAFIATFLFTTTPTVLAFSGLAYTDIAAACTQFAALLALLSWMDKPNRPKTVWLGFAVGLALLSKLTTLIYLPVCAVGFVLTRFLVRRWSHGSSNKEAATGKWGSWILKSATAGALALIVLCGGYRFSVGRVREEIGLTPESMPSFQHFPGFVRSMAERAVISDWIIPAPALVHGFAFAWVVNKMHLQSYMLGRVTEGGVWYFFFVALAVKTPLALWAMWGLGLWFLLTGPYKKAWRAWALALVPLFILVAAIPIQYKEGVRHILVIFPALAVVAGYGAATLWTKSGPLRSAGKITVLFLVTWQALSSISAGADFISYYNALAGKDPSRVYMTGCDFDCGQDLARLAVETRKKHISSLSIAVWSSADIYRMGLPKIEILQPKQPVRGWVAISKRSQALGHVFHTSYPPEAFAWLDQYKPVEQVGRTISLYYVPEVQTAQQQNGPAR